MVILVIRRAEGVDLVRIHLVDVETDEMTISTVRDLVIEEVEVVVEAIATIEDDATSPSLVTTVIGMAEAVLPGVKPPRPRPPKN